MDAFTRLTGVAAPLLQPNIDTDAIIPSREMKQVSKTGLADGLFANWRYSDVAARTEAPDFVLNRPRYRHAQILIGGANFGCGSSREHAVWALKEYGVRCVIAPSFGAIFQGNCVRNGVLPIILPDAAVEALAKAVDAAPDPSLSIDLAEGVITPPSGDPIPFSIGPADREMLLEGLDPIDVTLKRRAEIIAFETAAKPIRPWAFKPLRST
jgi:3-isopropylmalate/(R)-2-methylmalate dehydratase small subunit